MQVEKNLEKEVVKVAGLGGEHMSSQRWVIVGYCEMVLYNRL